MSLATSARNLSFWLKAKVHLSGLSGIAEGRDAWADPAIPAGPLNPPILGDFEIFWFPPELGGEGGKFKL
ncbi:MAG: hypothetical protein VKJ46_09925 [Leptolyngbyaceae bacterium]|nr:hypothetical protein [Leptolyngbyaceae bacterium]